MYTQLMSPTGMRLKDDFRPSILYTFHLIFSYCRLAILKINHLSRSVKGIQAYRQIYDTKFLRRNAILYGYVFL